MKINQTKKGQKTRPDKRVELRLPPRLYQMVADTAEMEDLSVNWWLVKTLDAVFLDVRYGNPAYSAAVEQRQRWLTHGPDGYTAEGVPIEAKTAP